VLTEIGASGADIVMLQEIVPQSEKLLRQGLSSLGYQLSVPNPSSCKPPLPYFVGLAIKESTIEFQGAYTDHFQGTSMYRHVHSAHCEHISTSMHIDIMTAHFESLGDNAAKRRMQASFTQDLMLSSQADLVIFGGDTNLREDEGGNPPPFSLVRHW
jgi:exonuclease III